MEQMKTTTLALFALVCVTTFFSCKKDKAVEPAPESSPVFVRLTDAPGPYTAVNVDIKGVEITSNGNASMLNINAGIYNLLDFANGVDTLIATGNITADKIDQIRLILGPNNTVVKGGSTYTLSTPSAEQSGLKIQVHQTLQPGIAYYVLLDFDANQSVVEQGNGSYNLKPVIRSFETAISGSIKGMVSVPNVPCTVTANSGTGAYSTVVNANGDFILKGLPAGTYTVAVNPVSPYNGSTLNNVVVTTGSVTLTGTINI
jgi:hypothetical protein